MNPEIFKKKEISPREKARLELAESLVPAIINLREKTGIGMKSAIIEILKRKGITAQEDIEYYTRTIPSLAGKRGAWSREKKRAAEAKEIAGNQNFAERNKEKFLSMQKTQTNKERQLDLFN